MTKGKKVSHLVYWFACDYCKFQGAGERAHPAKEKSSQFLSILDELGKVLTVSPEETPM